jgi:RNA 2',3'-cyclic 3'-phosphodiesterase
MDDQRLFVALPVPADRRRAFTTVQRDLRQRLPRAHLHFPGPEQLHLTVRFLGHVRAEHVPALGLALAEALAGQPAVELAAQRLGVFPERRFPRGVWAEVLDVAGELERLRARTEAVAKLFTRDAPDARWVPHVTLARSHSLPRPQAQELVAYVEEFGESLIEQWPAPEAQLIETETRPEGTRYTVLATVPLRR